MSDKKAKPILYCFFCGKSQRDVRKLVAGPKAIICNECIELSADIIREETIKEGTSYAKFAAFYSRKPNSLELFNNFFKPIKPPKL